MSRPPFSISQISSFNASYQEDLDAYRAAGCDGIGLWEYKLPRGGDDASLGALRASGLRATICVPEVASFVHDGFFQEPKDPAMRLDAIRDSIVRLAPFEPTAILLMSGDPANSTPEETRRLTVEGLRVSADLAADVGLSVAFEPLRQASGSVVSTLPEALTLIDEVDRSNVGVIVDLWHLWDTPGFLEGLASQAERIGGVQVCDIRQPTRSWCDRVLPGTGSVDFSAVLEALARGGYDGWYDLEIFSDDGHYGDDFPDSLWRLPAADLAKEAIDSWHAQLDAWRGSS